MKELENLKIVEVFETKAHFFVAKIPYIHIIYEVILQRWNKRYSIL